MNVKGIFAVDKPVGITSQRAVQIVKYWARRKTGDKKIKVGHAGTLDPLASGVLVMAVGREYTRKIDSIVKAEKEYIADIILGENSSTDDAEGEKIIINKDIQPDRKEVQKCTNQFIGNITQIPSAYSAIKIDGEEAYKKARRGEVVVMKERVIEIKDIKILEYRYPNLRISVVCGKGTYIRTLARDIGKYLNTGAYLGGLRRTRVGEFTLELSNSIDEFCMDIAVHASELDENRIDGTRVYLKEVLDRFGEKAKEDKFYIYHKNKFNNKLSPRKYTNYIIKRLKNIPMWTQTMFAFEILIKKPDVVWMPLHNVCRIRSKKTKVVVTIHDLAFKVFPDTFTKKDLRRLNIQTDYAVKNSDSIIAVSKATRNDILRFYPSIKSDKITVVHHGIDKKQWQKKYEKEVISKVLGAYDLLNCEFLIHVGAIQPRKDIKTIIDSFNIFKKKNKILKLVLVGGDGWMSEDIHEYAEKCKHSNDIIFTGNIDFDEVKVLMQNASVFIFASKYEGFGLPVLEACAVGLPVVSTKNSSIPEILGENALYFNDGDSVQCAENIAKIFSNEDLRERLRKCTNERVEKFSWDNCSRRTLQVLRK